MAASSVKRDSTQKGPKRAPLNKIKDDFFVQKDNIPIVVQYKEKIETMYEIELVLEEQTEEGQWMVLHGDSVDRRNAKNYINAMCNPTEVKQVQFPSASRITDPSTLEYIEKRTNAFIRPMKQVAMFQISGTELAVTLALSEIEELAGRGIEGQDCDVNEVDQDVIDGEDVIEISPSTHKASSRLSDVLARALSSHSDGGCSAADYMNTCPSVQRVLVNCLQDRDENEFSDEDSLFGDGKTNVEKNTDNVSGTSSLSGAKTLSIFYENSEDIQLPGKPDKTLTVPEVSYSTEKMAQLKLEPQLEPVPSKLLTKQQEYLKSFGLSVGFEESKVITAIKFVDEKTRPSDFLDILNSLPDESDDNDNGINKPVEDAHDDKQEVGAHSHIGYSSDDDAVIIESETVEYIGHDTSRESEEASKDTVAGKPALPDGYKERLILDFFAEDENCSREELKRRNAERQQLLRQNFSQNKQGQQGRNEWQDAAQDIAQGKKKKKRKKKKGKACDNQADKTSEDQTCVMEVWQAKGEKEPHKMDVNEEPFQTTPKKKNKQKQNFPNSPLLPAQGQNRQNSPNRNQQHINSPNRGQQQIGVAAGTPKWNLQSHWNAQNKPNVNPQNNGAQKRNYVKPTQVVAPVNVPKPNEGTFQPEISTSNDNSELRYIVIDGSNVAMTHGNGKHFSCKGIKICVEYFRRRGHDKITVFLPQWRQYRPSENNPILDQDILQELKDDGTLVFTPSRKIDHKLVASYDDRFVLELAEAEEGIIVSNDQYRDLMTEKAAWKKIIHERLLMFSFVRDRFMPPNDPLGREGPCLDDFLKINQQQNGPHNPRLMQGQGYQNRQQHQYYKPQGQGYAPYYQGQGLNYGYAQNQGQNYGQGHGNFHAQNQVPGNYQQNPVSYAGGIGSGQHQYGQQQHGNFNAKNQTQSYMDNSDGSNELSKSPRQRPSWKAKPQRIPRSEELSVEFFHELKKIFPEADQEDKIRNVLSNHIYEHDLMKLTNDCMNVLF